MRKLLKAYISFSPLVILAVAIIFAFPIIFVRRIGLNMYWGIPISILLEVIALVSFYFSPSYKDKE